MRTQLDARPWWSSAWATLLAATVITGGVLASAAHLPAEDGQRGIDALAVLLGVVGAWSLLLRWVHPYLMLAVTFGAVLTYALLGYPGGPTYLAAPIALVCFGLARPRRELYVVAAALVLLLSIGTVVATGWNSLLASLGYLGWACIAVLAAELLRVRAERSAARREALRRGQHQALAEQQLGLARDLHDSVAHALTAINVQAAIAERTAHRDPDAAAAAARAIRETSGIALSELTAIVRSMRSGGAPTAPERGLGDIAALVDDGRRVGLDIDLIEPAGPAASDSVQAAAAYRLVQEALTNAIRYAPGSSVRVVVDRRDGLLVSVRDDGGASTPGVGQVHGTGHGLLGMRERVVASGGTLHHGPCAPSGFEVVGRWTRN